MDSSQMANVEEYTDNCRENDGYNNRSHNVSAVLGHVGTLQRTAAHQIKSVMRRQWFGATLVAWIRRSTTRIVARFVSRFRHTTILSRSGWLAQRAAWQCRNSAVESSGPN